MNIFLRQISDNLPADEHLILILDRAGYHTAKRLEKPENITLLYLPPYSPELNPIERLWHYLRDHYWSNRCYQNEEALEKAAIEAWLKTCGKTENIQSICAVNYL